jgi:glutamine cyclotransferase
LYASSSSQTPTLAYTINAKYPHRTDDFTQGFTFHNERLIECTGLYGHSKVIARKSISSPPQTKAQLPKAFFGEGCTAINQQLYWITWKAQTGLVIDLNTFTQTGQFNYEGEGWGLTNDGHSLWMSNGSHIIKQLDAKNFKTIKTIVVTEKGKALTQINELEWVNGKILANVWQSSRIVVINPETGEVEAQIEFDDLLTSKERPGHGGVLNGIAYHHDSKQLLVTGKRWSWIYEISVAGINTRE